MNIKSIQTRAVNYWYILLKERDTVYRIRHSSCTKERNVEGITVYGRVGVKQENKKVHRIGASKERSRVLLDHIVYDIKFTSYR